MTLGRFLTDDVGRSVGINSYTKWLQNPTHLTAEGNACELEKNNNNVLIGVLYDPDRPKMELSIDNLLEIISKWEKLLEENPPFMLLKKEGDKITLEGIGDRVIDSVAGNARFDITTPWKELRLKKDFLTNMEFLVRTFGFDPTLNNKNSHFLIGLHYWPAMEIGLQQTDLFNLITKTTRPDGVIDAEFLFLNKIIFKKYFPSKWSLEDTVDHMIAASVHYDTLQTALKINGKFVLQGMSQDLTVAIRIIVDKDGAYESTHPI